MTLIAILTEPAIIIITAIFLFFIFYTLLNYSKTERNLKSVYGFMRTFEKKRNFL